MTQAADTIDVPFDRIALRLRYRRNAWLATAGLLLGRAHFPYLHLLSLHHYADHVEANLLDAEALLSNTVSVAIAAAAERACCPRRPLLGGGGRHRPGAVAPISSGLASLSAALVSPLRAVVPSQRYL